MTPHATTSAPCRGCGYDLQGVELAVCPECGLKVPEPEPERDLGLLKRVASDRGLKCRHCKRPLAELQDGACACGATYQLAAESGRRTGARSSGGFVDVVVLLGAIGGAAVALISVVFSGVAQANNPPWLAVGLGLVPAGMLAVWVVLRPVMRLLPREVELLLQLGLAAISLLCLGAAVTKLF